MHVLVLACGFSYKRQHAGRRLLDMLIERALRGTLCKQRAAIKAVSGCDICCLRSHDSKNVM